MKKKNGVKILQTAGYNGARTVYKNLVKTLFRKDVTTFWENALEDYAFTGLEKSDRNVKDQEINRKERDSNIFLFSQANVKQKLILHTDSPLHLT